MQHHWSGIQKDTARFCSCVVEQNRRNESGKTNDDRLHDALEHFEGVVKRSFHYMHYWYILRSERKWLDKLSGKEEERSKGKGTTAASASAQGSGTGGGEEEGRPIGRDRAKKLRSGEGGSSTSSANLEVL
ncbi:hypothetical protein BAE44_0008191 [Dichanthelium oligosanthes]|uniref:Uncharacterized protein n=1 Tax=Dichanthelium oligosanthes TaxID=888268 RepID=A0A1E5W0L0_9POAL|nr:hypothetical protein BAE44_0008191 [Dichanthelium oligosanthes]